MPTGKAECGPNDFSAAKHLAAISKILELARLPYRCNVTKRATEDIVRLRLTKAAVLEAVCDHLERQKPTYVLIRTGIEATLCSRV